MIYTPLTKQAMQIAYQAHHGQTDHGGIPYVFHPIHLAEQMNDEYTTCAALLHDVVEDTSVTLEELAAVFPVEIVNAVALLTHADDVAYLDYVENIKANPIARAVKLADLHHNCDRTRLEVDGCEEDAIRRYETKYRKALEILE
jgi:(p)ppGpp synthase/HD superfamily hydrolase